MGKKRGRRSAVETQDEILDVAESWFASVGFEATRLEDIAEQVGVKRAALFYYFKDKREIYEGTLARLWSDLMAGLQKKLVADTPLVQRIEDGLSAVVDFIDERPAFPRLVLRLASESSIEGRSSADQLSGPFFKVLDGVLAEGEQAGLLAPVVRNPPLLAATLAGATIFYVAAMPAYTSVGNTSPFEVNKLDTHRQDVLAILRKLLGLPTEET